MPPTPSPAAGGGHSAALETTLLVIIGALYIAHRAHRWRRDRMATLRTELESLAAMVRTYPEGSSAHALYAREANAMAEEIRRLRAFGARKVAGVGVAGALVLFVAVATTR